MNQRKIIPSTLLILLILIQVIPILPSARASTHTDISATEGYRMIYSNISDLIILDVRNPSDYNAGKIPNATNVPIYLPQPFNFTDFNNWINGPGQAHKDDPIIIYCGSGTRSNLAAINLTNNGFTKVYDMTPYSTWVSYVNVVRTVTHYNIITYSTHVGAPCTFYVTAQDNSNITVSYNGTVNIISSDAIAIIPSTLLLTNGTGSFVMYWRGFWAQNVSVFELANDAVNGTYAGSVIPALFVVNVQPNNITAGSSVIVNVTAYCPSYNRQYDFGTGGHGAFINFTSTDSQAIFPSEAIQLSQASAEFAVTLRTPGTQTITVTDAEFDSVTGISQVITVNNAPIPTQSPTPQPTETPSPTLTPTPTATPTPTPSPSPSPTPSASPSPIPTTQPTIAPTSTPTSTRSPTSTPTPTTTHFPSPSPTTVLATKDTGSTVEVTISGNVTISQMSNITITSNQDAGSTTISFAINGVSGSTGFGNVTIPKNSVAYGTTPKIYIDNLTASNQGYNQDSNNYYVWYTTHFSTQHLLIVFTTTTSSPTPIISSGLPQEIIYGIATVTTIFTIASVVLILRRQPKIKS